MKSGNCNGCYCNGCCNGWGRVGNVLGGTALGGVEGPATPPPPRTVQRWVPPQQGDECVQMQFFPFHCHAHKHKDLQGFTMDFADLHIQNMIFGALRALNIKTLQGFTRDLLIPNVPQGGALAQ